MVHPDGDRYYCGCDTDADCGDGQCCEGSCFSLFDSQHCGGCDNDCADHVENVQAPVCEEGVCGYDQCAPGFLDCDNNRSNGCELPQDDDNCGACGFSCGPNASCGASGCMCAENFGNCNDDWASGCESDLLNDTAHCGACHIDCVETIANATGELCLNGACDYTTCSGGWDDCDSNRANGCELSIWDVASCGTDCSTVNCMDTLLNASGQSCEQGVCDYDSCLAGYGDCDSGPTDGCETHIWDIHACGTNCSNRVDCTDDAVVSNSVGEWCDSGLCNYGTCQAGYDDCNADRTDGCEKDIWMTNQCGTDCSTVNCSLTVTNASGKACDEGVCDYGSCSAGYGDCDGDRTDGCEEHLWSNTRCRLVCGDGPDCTEAVVNANGYCNEGSCDYHSCSYGFANCDSNRENGCEQPILHEDQNCGGCGIVCQDHHADNSCVNGTCFPQCDSHWDDCDEDPTNGCEQEIWLDPKNCGECGRVCPPELPICDAGACRYPR
jgi:hypothetical protein